MLFDKCDLEPLTITATASTTYHEGIHNLLTPRSFIPCTTLLVQKLNYDIHLVPFEYSFGATSDVQFKSCDEIRKISR